MTHALACVALVASTGRAYADEDDEDDEDRDPHAESLTSSTLFRDDLDLRPHLRTTDLFRYLPGVFALGSSGQADHLLVRGFAGQGDAVGILVDGVPVNLGSHAYAQGYADTHFLIPDAVGAIAIHEGSYAPRFGTFSTAGTLDVRTLDAVPEGARVRITSGTELTGELPTQRLRRLRYRLVGMASPKLDEGSALLAAEVGIDDGPYVHPERFRRGAVLAKVRRHVGRGSVFGAFQMYSGRWLASGLLAHHELAAGRLTPYSAADPSQGGIALRTSVSAGYEIETTKETWRIAAYLVDSDLRLYANPTLFARDPVDGDQLEYVDTRVSYGLDAAYTRRHRVADEPAVLRVGLQARADHATATTWHDERRHRLPACFGPTNPCTDTAPSMRSIAGYVEETIDVARRVQVLGGLRLDQESWNVEDRDADTMLGAATLGGTGARARLGPRLGVRYHRRELELSALGAAGAHATDARASADASGYGAFVRTFAGELGARVRAGRVLEGAASVWASELEDHHTWNAALGAGERIPASRRYGIETRVQARPRPWLALDAALSVARGHYTGSDAPLPYAPRLIGHAGVAVTRNASHAAVRLRALGARATTDPQLTAAPITLVDLVARHPWRSFELGLTVENLLAADWREVQVAGALRTSRRADVTHQMLVAPGAPLTLMLTLGYATR